MTEKDTRVQKIQNGNLDFNKNMVGHLEECVMISENRYLLFSF